MEGCSLWSACTSSKTSKEKKTYLQERTHKARTLLYGPKNNSIVSRLQIFGSSSLKFLFFSIRVRPSCNCYLCLISTHIIYISRVQVHLLKHIGSLIMALTVTNWIKRNWLDIFSTAPLFGSYELNQQFEILWLSCLFNWNLCFVLV